MEHLSVIEQLMQKLQDENRIRLIDEGMTYQMQKDINNQMLTFDIEKQKKAAHSQQDLAKIVLTA